jgi:putative NADH-flavin reductase
VLRGDPLHAAELRAALPDHDAVLSALGPPGPGPTTILRECARSIVAAMHAVGTHRILVVFAAVLFPDTGLLGAMLRHTLLRNVARDAAEMERIVIASGLDWTIARPPRLTNGPLTERYLVSDGHMPRGRGSVSRAAWPTFCSMRSSRGGHMHQIVGMAGVGRRTSPERHTRVQTHPLTNESGQHQV